jgi:hypothetical protein
MECDTVNTQPLEATARMMVADGKGLLAIDESTATCNKRFAKWEIPQTAEAHRQYRQLIVDTPGLNESITRRFDRRRMMALRLQRLSVRSESFPASRSTSVPRRWRRFQARKLRRVWTVCASG